MNPLLWHGWLVTSPQTLMSDICCQIPRNGVKLSQNNVKVFISLVWSYRELSYISEMDDIQVHFVCYSSCYMDFSPNHTIVMKLFFHKLPCGNRQVPLQWLMGTIDDPILSRVSACLLQMYFSFSPSTFNFLPHICWTCSTFWEPCGVHASLLRADWPEPTQTEHFHQWEWCARAEPCCSPWLLMTLRGWSYKSCGAAFVYSSYWTHWQERVLHNSTIASQRFNRLSFSVWDILRLQSWSRWRSE